MRYILLTLGFGILSISHVIAQKSAFSIGPEAGLQFTKLEEKLNGETSVGDYKTGARIGVLAHVRITRNFSFQTGVYYNHKGYETDRVIRRPINEMVYTEDIHRKVELHCIEVPLLVQYNLIKGQQGNFFVGGGAYANIVSSGEIEQQYVRTLSIGGFTTSVTEVYERDLEIGDKPTVHDIESGDSGMNLHLGYKWDRGILIRTHVNYGFANLLPGGDANNSLTNFSFGITAGYLIGF